MKNSFRTTVLALILSLVLLIAGCEFSDLPESGEPLGTTTTLSTTTTKTDDPDNEKLPEDPDAEIPALTMPVIDLAAVPWYTGTPYVPINDNKPYFTENQYTQKSYEYYSELDALGRCYIAVANIGVDIMPTEDRESISSVYPSGWQSVKYDIVSGKYLYNRCHLIGFQLSGENANEKNLITGTRYMNVDGMLPFENMVADYVTETENHVLLRVTPVFVENELVARGVLMEGYSVEDNGEGICFNVFVYNVQPGIVINYEDGTSYLEGGAPSGPNDGNGENEYVLNTNTKKFHDPDCPSASSMSEANKQIYHGDRQDLIDDGYTPCGNCKP